MNWDVVAAFAELAAAIGVIISLLYVAKQITQNTKAMRRTASHESVQGMLNWFGHVFADPELTRIWTQGIESLDSLSADERARFALLQFNLLKVAEDIHFQQLDGAMDPDLWQGWDRLWAQYLGAPGSKEYWASRAPLFSGRFRDYIEGLSPDPAYLRTRDFAASAQGQPRATGPGEVSP